MSRLRQDFPRFPIFLILVALALGLFGYMVFYPFPVSGHDAATHLEWFGQFASLHDQGIWYPRWLPLSMGGFGSIVFYFYPALAFILGGFVHSLVPTATATMLFHSAHALAGLLMFFCFVAYLKLNGVRWQYGAIGAIFLIIGPYRFYDIFQRSALGESVSFCWVVLLLLATDHCTRSEAAHRWRGFVYAAIGWCGLIMSNVPMTVITMMLLPLYTILRFGWRNTLRAWPLVVAPALGAVCAAVYVVPLLGVLHLVPTGHLSEVFEESRRWGYVLRDMFVKDAPKDSSSLAIPVCIAIALFASMLAKKEFGRSRFVTAMVSIGLVSIILQIPYVSLPLWDHIPVFGLIQFTGRFNLITSIAGAALLPYLLEQQIARGAIRWTAIASYALLIAVFARYIHIVFTAPFPPNISPERWNSAEHVPIYASAEGHGSRNYARLMMYEKPIEALAELPKGDTVFEKSNGPLLRTFHVTLSGPVRVRIHQYYWPYWVLHRDSTAIEQTPDNHGVVTALLPAGEYDITLKLTKMPEERVGSMMSFVGWLLVLGAGARAIQLAIASHRNRGVDGAESDR